MRTLKFIAAVVLMLATTFALGQGRRRGPGGFPPPQRPPQGRPAPPPMAPDKGQAGSQQQRQGNAPAQGMRPGGPMLQPGPRSGPRFGDWLRDHQNLPLDQQMKMLEQEPGFQQLPPQRQQNLRQRLQRFNSLPLQQRERILNNLDRLEHLTPEQRQHAEDIMGKFRGLSEDRRQMIGRAARRLADMDPQQQQQVLESPRMRQMFSDQERDILRGILDLQIGPAAPRPDQQPPGFD